MVGRPGKYQPRFVGGELDLYLDENTDEAAYFKGAALMQNVKPMPQGGFTNRWGTIKLGYARNVLAQYGSGSLVATAPNGGSAGNAIDGDISTYLTTNALAGSNTVLHIDLGANKQVSCVDLESFGANLSGGAFPAIAEPTPPLSPAIGGVVNVQYSTDDATWTQLWGLCNLPDTLRTRRYAAPPGSPVTARYIRVLVNVTSGASGSTIFNLANIRIWQETTTVSEMRIRSFTHSRALAYDFVFTDRNVDVYTAGPLGGWVGAISLAVAGVAIEDIPDVTGYSMIDTMKNAQQLDTMLTFHQMCPPLRLMRQGTDFEWNSELAPFQNVPNYDYGAGYSNGVAAQWQIEFFNFDSTLSGNFPLPSGGAHYTISVNGVATPAIQQPPGSYTGTAAALQAAILALPGVSPGVTVAQVGTSEAFLITFTGIGNEGDGWAVSGNCVDKGDAVISAAHVTVGVVGGEPLMSESQGWPASGCFYEQSTVMAGFAGVPNVFLKSETGNYYELNTALVASTAPMLVPLDTDGAATIIAVHQGRSLDFFCDAGEYWFASPPFDRTTTPTIPKATNVGISPLVDAFENEGKTYFVAKEGGAIFEFVFNYALQNYDANNVSVFASSLVKDLIDGSYRRLAQSTDLNEYYCVRADGTAILMSLLRQQEINAFSRVVTDGAFLCVNVNDQLDVTWGTQRQVNGQPVQFVERMVEGVFLDCQTTAHVNANDTTVSNLSDHIGATVYVLVDNYWQGPFTVSGSGQISLAFPPEATGKAAVGRWIAPLVSTLPQPKDVAPRTVVHRPCRVHTVRATVVATANVAISANDTLIVSSPDDNGQVEIIGVSPGDGPYDVPFARYNQATDNPLHLNPYTGPIVVEGLQGFSEDGIVTFTQLRPGRLTVTGVTVEVDL